MQLEDFLGYRSSFLDSLDLTLFSSIGKESPWILNLRIAFIIISIVTWIVGFALAIMWSTTGAYQFFPSLTLSRKGRTLLALAGSDRVYPRILVFKLHIILLEGFRTNQRHLCRSQKCNFLRCQ